MEQYVAFYKTVCANVCKLIETNAAALHGLQSLHPETMSPANEDIARKYFVELTGHLRELHCISDDDADLGLVAYMVLVRERPFTYEATASILDFWCSFGQDGSRASLMKIVRHAFMLGKYCVPHEIRCRTPKPLHLVCQSALGLTSAYNFVRQFLVDADCDVTTFSRHPSVLSHLRAGNIDRECHLSRNVDMTVSMENFMTPRRMFRNAYVSTQLLSGLSIQLRLGLKRKWYTDLLQRVYNFSLPEKSNDLSRLRTTLQAIMTETEEGGDRVCGGTM